MLKAMSIGEAHTVAVYAGHISAFLLVVLNTDYQKHENMGGLHKCSDLYSIFKPAIMACQWAKPR